MTLTVEQAKRLHGINDSWHMAPDEENFLVRSTESLIREHGEDRVKHSDSRKSRTPQELHQPDHLQLSSRKSTEGCLSWSYPCGGSMFFLAGSCVVRACGSPLKKPVVHQHDDRRTDFQSRQFDTGEQIPDAEA